MPELHHEDSGVFLLDLGDSENRFHPDWIASVNQALDRVAAADQPRALVTVATGKFFSNGLDLDWMSSAHEDHHRPYVDSAERLFARVLSLPVITVAAIQGHAFAAGAMLALAHDFRVMRADRGFWCVPEVDINMPFTPGMAALLQSRLTAQTAHEAMVTGRRYGGDEAVRRGIVDKAVDEGQVRSAAIAIAAGNTAKAGTTLGIIKQRMYGPALSALESSDHKEV